jgi:hypothetical protein
MKLTIIILMILILTCLLIISNNNLAFSNSENFKEFGELWLDWIDKVFLNFKDVTGQVIGMDWSP